MLSTSQSQLALYPSSREEYARHIEQLKTQLLASHLPIEGSKDTELHLQAISKAVIGATAPSYFGFVTGGVTPVAARADNLVTQLDANVQVHLPKYSIATVVEDTALRWLLELLKLDERDWKHRTFTTGATASNILGLACGRDFVVREAGRRNGLEDVSVAEFGLSDALKLVGIEGIQILTTMPHSSIRKASSVVGLGRNSVIDVTDPSTPLLFDLEALKKHLNKPKTVSIVAVSCGEVNTGQFATTRNYMHEIRKLCDDHGAWIHVDAAFGILARCLPAEKFPLLVDGTAGIELADSIASDGHKLFNVPYDCGIFWSKHRDVAESVFQNAGAAYLGSAYSDPNTIASPLNIGIENSRRFRALPMYASLHAYGIQGYVDIIERQVNTARRVASWVNEHEAYTLLPSKTGKGVKNMDNIYMIVLFRASDSGLNDILVDLINESGQMYVSGTAWDDQKAVRIAISNWQVVPEREAKVVESVLEKIANDWAERLV
ncbi:PLP-dependent transferase [Microthyrium microscopicum]|uniref:PLP-dependent transferase n=1 Tax=Microthyrium microscopicum TaxID=703497 RepID=A0A6A6TYK3_9PEZI|nr:PLP-dependent transferase [Microthyrium microscopicum]